METIILSEEKVKPSKPTPQHLRNHKLCFFDQLILGVTVEAILFYKTTSDQKHISNNKYHLLKEALSETLTLLYPLAGQVITQGSTSSYVNCNDHGVLYVEARVKTLRLFEFLDNPDLLQLKKFLPPPATNNYYNSQPVFIQVTRFDCGGTAIAVRISHKVLDASSMSIFLNTWAYNMRMMINNHLPPPHDIDFKSSSLLFPAQDHLPDEFFTFLKSLTFTEGTESLYRRFLFDAKAIAAIKMKAAATSFHPTSVEALTAFLWRHMILASRAVKLGSPSSSMLTHAVNLRPRLDPPLPCAFGNLFWTATAFHKYDQIIELPHLVGILRDMFDNLKGESLKALEGDAPFNYLMDLATDAETNTSVSQVDKYNFSSWCRAGLNHVDFGWGNPIWIAPGVDFSAISSFNYVQIVFLVESGWSTDGIEAWIHTNKEEMLVLENDEEFLQYASPNPSIPLPAS